jgi:hypothetical protein
MPAASKRLCLPLLLPLLLLAGCGRPPADDRGRAGPDLTHEKLLQLAHEPGGAAVEEGTLDDLFATVPSGDLPRFLALRKLLEQQLSGVKATRSAARPSATSTSSARPGTARWPGSRPAWSRRSSSPECARRGR